MLSLVPQMMLLNLLDIGSLILESLEPNPVTLTGPDLKLKLPLILRQSSPSVANEDHSKGIIENFYKSLEYIKVPKSFLGKSSQWKKIAILIGGRFQT